MVLPPAYAAHGYQGGILPAVKVGITAYLIGLPLAGFNRALILALAFGYGTGMVGDDPPAIHDMSASVFLSHIAYLFFALGFVCSTSVSLIVDSSRLWNHKRKILVGYLIFLFLLSFLTFARAIDLFTGDRKYEIALAILYFDAAIIFVIGGSFAVSLPLGVVFGSYLRAHIGPGIGVYRQLAPYFRAMIIPLIGFTFSYLFIIFFFANSYWAAWRFNSCCAFKNLPDQASYGDFFYFSVITIATLGYGDITPISPLTKMLTCAEVILGVGWITIVFAAVLAYLQPRFSLINRVQNRRRGVAKD